MFGTADGTENTSEDVFNVLVPQMAFASDKLYQGYLRRKMPTIVSRVKVREIIPYLPCLTDHDRVGFMSDATFPCGWAGFASMFK